MKTASRKYQERLPIPPQAQELIDKWKAEKREKIRTLPKKPEKTEERLPLPPQAQELIDKWEAERIEKEREIIKRNYERNCRERQAKLKKLQSLQSEQTSPAQQRIFTPPSLPDSFAEPSEEDTADNQVEPKKPSRASESSTGDNPPVNQPEALQELSSGHREDVCGDEHLSEENLRDTAQLLEVSSEGESLDDKIRKAIPEEEEARRQMWESSSAISVDGAIWEPVTPSAIAQSLVACNSPEKLKSLREAYSRSILNAAWVALGEAQKRIKGWVKESQPSQPAPDAVLIRCPWGEKWFQLKGLVRSQDDSSGSTATGQELGYENQGIIGEEHTLISAPAPEELGYENQGTIGEEHTLTPAPAAPEKLGYEDQGTIGEEHTLISAPAPEKLGYENQGTIGEEHTLISAPAPEKLGYENQGISGDNHTLTPAPEKNPLECPKYKLVREDSTLQKCLKPLQNAKVLGIDTETTGLDPHKHQIRLIQIAAPNHPVVIVDMKAITSADPLRALLQGKAIKIFHNAKFDLKFLMKAGLKPSAPLFDTQLAHQLLTAGLGGKHSLQAIASECLGIELEKENQVSDWSGELSSSQLEYAARDAAILLQLREVLKPKLIEAELVQAAKIEFDAVGAVAEMELSGMLLDLAKWDELAKDMECKKQAAAEKLKRVLKADNPQLSLLPEVREVDPDSPQQVLKALQAQGIPVNSTGKKAIAPLAGKYPVIDALLEYRKWAKAVSAFGATLPKHISPITGRIHPDIWQLGAVSGRCSCSNPNLQQVPRTFEVRHCFIPAPGNKLVIADYGQIELRIAAEISGDRTMIKAYQSGQDLHRLTASLVLDKPISEVSKSDRQLAKAVNFGLVFGMSAGGFQNYAEVNYGVKMTEKEAAAFRAKFFQGYKGLASWHKRSARELYGLGKLQTRTLANRRRRWNERPRLNEVLNMPVQGTSADITKQALALLPAALEGTGAKLIGTVHDEILLEAPEALASQVARILEKVMIEAGEKFLTRCTVEVEAKVASSWADK